MKSYKITVTKNDTDTDNKFAKEQVRLIVKGKNPAAVKQMMLKNGYKVIKIKLSK